MISRRQFLSAGASLGGGLLIGFTIGPAISAADAQSANSASFAPDAFIRIDPSGQVTLIMSYVEMGQGTYTSIPMLIAEELEDRPQIGSPRARPAERQALRESPVRISSHGRLDRDTCSVGTDAARGSNCANDAGASRGTALARRTLRHAVLKRVKSSMPPVVDV